MMKMIRMMLAGVVAMMMALVCPLVYAASEQEPSAKSVRDVMASLKPLNARIDPEAKFFMYVMVTIRTESSENLLVALAKEADKLESAGVQVIVCSCIATNEAMLSYVRSLKLPFPVMMEKASQAMPQYVWNPYTPSFTVIDDKGRLLRKGQCKEGAMPDWKAAIRSRPIEQRAGGVPGNLKMVKMISGRASVKARYYFYMVGRTTDPRLQDGVRRLASRYPEMRRAGVEVVFCVENGQGDEAEIRQFMKERKAKFPATLKESALLLPGFSDRYSGAYTILVDDTGKVIEVGEHDLAEGWKELISKCEKQKEESGAFGAETAPYAR